MNESLQWRRGTYRSTRSIYRVWGDKENGACNRGKEDKIFKFNVSECVNILKLIKPLAGKVQVLMKSCLTRIVRRRWSGWQSVTKENLRKGYIAREVLEVELKEEGGLKQRCRNIWRKSLREKLSGAGMAWMWSLMCHSGEEQGLCSRRTETV